MRESQIHDAFMAWLKRQGILYIHSAFGKKATMTKDMPDFIILHAGRALLVECKTEKGLLTHGQMEKFTEIQRNSGMVVQIARTVEQCVSAVTTWLGVESAGIQPQVSEAVASDLWIGNLFGTDYVFRGEASAGSTAEKVRRASPQDIRDLPRK